MLAQALYKIAGVENDTAGKEVLKRLRESEQYGRSWASVACHIFDEGQVKSAASCLYQQLRDVPEWHPEFDRFIRPVVRACAQQGMQKSAVFGAVKGALGKLLGATPAAVSTALLAAGAAGAAGGGLAHVVHRQARQDSVDNAQLEEKIRAYRQAARDIEEDLINSGALETADTSDDQAVLDRYLSRKK